MKIKFKLEKIKNIGKIIGKNKKSKEIKEQINEKVEEQIKEEVEEKVIKKRRRNVQNNNNLEETQEGNSQKKWKRKGSKINIAEFIKNFFLNKKQIKLNYYLLLFAMIILCTGSIYFTVSTYKDGAEEYLTLTALSVYENNDVGIYEDKNTEQTEEQIVKIIEQKQEVNNAINQNKVVQAVDNVVKQVAKKEVEKIEFIKPITGDILKIYSIDKVIYSKTLDMWKIHDGIDIKGELGSIIVASEKGTVEKIYNDSFYGNTVVISHLQGYKSSYSNLNDTMYVEVGQEVKKGQKIGQIGQSAIGEIKDEPHLHFMLYKDNENIDPSNIFYK